MVLLGSLPQSHKFGPDGCQPVAITIVVNSLFLILALAQDHYLDREASRCLEDYLMLYSTNNDSFLRGYPPQ